MLASQNFFDRPILHMEEDTNIVRPYYHLMALAAHVKCVAIEKTVDARNKVVNNFHRVPNDFRELIATITKQDSCNEFQEQVLKP
eukprot:187935-Prorocentrum_minimum.AAC.1